ncbi:MAG: hypothetical protein A3E82_03140 [Gammaproteobacteria bacterium RIFCSPHIGHO2_12_FULL_38_11]|nr:MAG: hypothetical protein A3E82_03140 [Gammaproteobacteria bacterium RIFCSPHIGHO2_12_FULL_38_11]
MLRNLGLFQLESISLDNYLEVDLSKYSLGINEIDDYFFKLNDDQKVEWVVSRVCDHANGRLARKGCDSIARCPLHGWTLDLDKLQYINVQVEKKRLDFKQNDNILFIEKNQFFLQVPSQYKTFNPKEISVRFLAHASLAITIDNFTIVTDPWLIGPCFMSGWWHKVIPKADVMDIMINANLIYISHNHPDHMHMETLLYLKNKRPNIPIIVPPFSSESVVRPLKSYGFTNIISLPFNNIFLVNERKILLSILKSGDFRDDSGLFFMAGEFSGLLTVDAAALNRMILPKNIDFLATAFAGGASGYPWCFDHYPIEQRQEISDQSKRAVMKHAMDYIKITQPKNYMPYAGYFSEEASRDNFIKINNKKNSVDDIKNLLFKIIPDIHFIDPTITDLVRFNADGAILEKENIKLDPLYQMDQSYVDLYLEKEMGSGRCFDIKHVADYFLSCKFHDDLIVYLVPTDSVFDSSPNGLKIDFSNTEVIVDIMNSSALQVDYEISSPLKKKVIKVRQDALWLVIKNALSWEELSIGFQCRIVRRPDVYNSKFWDYFTNTYTNFNN